MMPLYVIVNIGKLGIVTVHIRLCSRISLLHTHKYVPCAPLCAHDHRGVRWGPHGQFVLCVCTEAKDTIFLCVYPGHIVWTGKMRMDGIVITEWRYPHSVKLEKAGRKPPTGTASKERVVVMVIGEFKQGFANL